MSNFETILAQAIRESVKVGNIGPNSAAIIADGGTVSLTTTEAQEAAAHVADAIREWLTNDHTIALAAEGLGSHELYGGGLYCTCQPEDEDGTRDVMTEDPHTHLARTAITAALTNQER